MYLGVTQDIVFNIEGKPHTVTLSVDYIEGAPYNQRYYWINAITETGFDLCNLHHGYFTTNIKAPKQRLRSEFSIANDMLGVLESLEQDIRKIEDKIIVTERTVMGKIDYTTCYLWIEGLQWTSAANISSKQSKIGISWHEHNVYNEGDIELRVFRNEEGQLRLEADEAKLYDMAKLRALHDSEAFQQSKLAFFFYNEVRRLLGMPVSGHPNRMSGLFHHPNVQE